MEPEPMIDPSHAEREASSEEINAWAARERRRREAWLAGPSEEEKQEWVRRWRWRAAVGLAESRLPPTREEVEAWGVREHARREAWLAGPSEDEKQDWVRGRLRASAMGLPGSPLPPAPEEADAWAEAERARRREWVTGPSEEEKRDWSRRRPGSLPFEMPPAAREISEAGRHFFREAELAGKGALYAMTRAPAELWNYFVRAGRSFEQESYRQPRRGRVPF
jgi:hypothetical protein